MNIFSLFWSVYNDGTTKDLVTLTGTIPVMFKGNNDLVFYTGGVYESAKS